MTTEVIWNHNNELGLALLDELPERVGSALELGCGQGYPTAPVRDPEESYAAVEAAARRILPGVRYQRHSLFRYSLMWTRPPH